MDIVWDGAIMRRKYVKKVVKNSKYMKAFEYPETVRIKLYFLAYPHKWCTTIKFVDVLQLAAPRVKCVMFTEQLGGIRNLHTSEIPLHVTWEQLPPHKSWFTTAPSTLGDLQISKISLISRIETEYNTE